MGRVKEFLSLYLNSNTITSYKTGICTFFDFIYGEQKKSNRMTLAEFEKYDNLATKYLTEITRDHFEDLLRFSASLNNRPPHTARGYLNTAREFLVQNNREFNNRQIRAMRNKLPKGGARTVEGDMDHEVLRTILNHMDVK